MKGRDEILGKYDKGTLIGMYGWEFTAELENKLLERWPERDRKKAMMEFGVEMTQEIEDGFVESEIKKEKKRLEDYYGKAMHYSEKIIHIMFDDNPDVDDVYIDNLIRKRQEYEKFVEQTKTDKMIYDTAMSKKSYER